MGEVMITEQQTKDYEIITNVWRLLRDYGDITIDQDDRWEALVHNAADMGRQMPEAHRIINAVLHELQERCRRKAGLA